MLSSAANPDDTGLENAKAPIGCAREYGTYWHRGRNSPPARRPGLPRGPKPGHANGALATVL